MPKHSAKICISLTKNLWYAYQGSGSGEILRACASSLKISEVLLSSLLLPLSRYFRIGFCQNLIAFSASDSIPLRFASFQWH